MLSDSCFQLIDDLLEAICNYDYSDSYKNKLITIIMQLNEIRDDLDRCGTGNLLINNMLESTKIATKMFINAQKKRDMHGVDFYDMS